MSSGDKILNRISLDCDERISQIGAETDEKCAQIMAQAKLDADKISAEIADRAQSKVKQMQAASKSRCDLETRNAFLKRRREEIDKTYSEILNKMKNLPDEDYFELIYTFAKKLNGMSGVVLLNEKDMNRLPKNFLARLEKCGVKAELSKAPCDIESGFILKCGDIEENMDFSAILSEKRDAIEDFTNRQFECETMSLVGI